MVHFVSVQEANVDRCSVYSCGSSVLSLSQKLLQSTLNLAIHSIFLAAKQIEESILFRKVNYENQG